MRQPGLWLSGPLEMMLDKREKWILRNGSIAVVLILLWNTVFLRPLKLLVILFHESFHALSALLTGGGVSTIEVTSYETGLTSLYGGFPIIVYSAGYIGTAFLGSLFLVSGYRYPLKRYLYLVIGLFLVVNSLIFIGNPFGWAYGLSVGLFFILLFLKEFWFSTYVTDLLGLMCFVDVLYDFTGFLTSAGRNDAFILHELTGIPYLFILFTWIIATLIMVFSAIYIPLKVLNPEKVEQHLEWDEFHFITERKVKKEKEMARFKEDSYKKQTRRTIIVYLSILGAAVLIVVYASRFVLFHPWTAREWVAAAAVQGKMYVAGGRDRQGQFYDEILRIDPKKLRIKEISRLPSPRFGMGGTSLGQRVYFMGGFDGKQCFDEILLLDTQQNLLTVAGHLPSPRAFGGVTPAKGKIYYLGGWDGSRQLDEIVSVDPESCGAEVIGRLPSPREFVTAVSLSDRIYLFGGSDERGEYLDEILEIDPISGTVLRRGNLPAARVRSSAAVLNNKIFMMGGWEGRRVDEVLLIDPSSEEILTQRFSKLSGGFSDISAVALEGNIFLIGGTHERFQRQINVLRIDPTSGTLESLRFRYFLFW